jgi:methylmalonyl-CoA mutase N-terminal domain/subunit
VEAGEAVIVGVNRFASQEPEPPLDTLRIDHTAHDHQAKKLRRLRKERHNGDVERSLNALRRAAEGDTNLMPFLIDAVRSWATVGEICDVLREVFGTYTERMSF